MTSARDHRDVIIVGGGLAGLTLALQINRESPATTVTVLEKNRFPVPEAAHKVGEATVEIGAHYLSHTLNLKEMLERTQLRKFGLRLFFGSEQRDDLAGADELGASRPLPAISYQLDRGKLENSLAGLLKAGGVELRDGCRVRKMTVGRRGGRHEIEADGQVGGQRLSCRWLVDASARSSLLKRKLNIAKASPHRMSAAWFRLDASLSVDDWSGCDDWRARCGGRPRRASTNHLMGNGYWAWIIPLAGDRTSVGLVVDPAVHDLEGINRFDRFRRWCRERQPMLANAIDNHADEKLDFHCRKDLTRDSQRLWSANGWALAGEAGLFADPFYSPGTDFIGMNNTFICDLVTGQRPFAERATRAAIFEKVCQSFFDSTMSLYQDLYGGFGDTRLMVIKSTWDYAYYWSILAWLFFRELMTDLAFLRRMQPELLRMRALNAAMQAEFRQRAGRRHVDNGSGRFFDQVAIPILLNLNTELLSASSLPDIELRENCERLDAVAPLLLSMLGGDQPGGAPCSLLGDLATRLA